MELLKWIFKFFKTIVGICLDLYKSLTYSNNYEKLSFMKENNNISNEQKKRGWGYVDSQLICKKDKDNRHYVTMTGSRYELANRNMYVLPPFINEMLDVNINFDKPAIKNPLIAAKSQIKEDSQLYQELVNLIEIDLDDQIRIHCSHGQTGTEQYLLQFGGNTEIKICDAVIYPKTEEELSNVVSYLNEYNKKINGTDEKSIKLTAAGGKTNVCWALKIDNNSTKIHIIADMTKYFNEILWIDKSNNIFCVGSGMNGKALELELQKMGCTMGHEPDSMEFSTCGGWVATRASGMKKNLYGNIEDMLLGIRGVNGCGEIFNSGMHDTECSSKLHNQYQYHSRVSHGISIKDCLLGCEGNSAIFTYCVFKCHTIENQIKEFDAMLVHNLDHSLKIARELIHNKQFMPASIRFVDYTQYLFGAALNSEPDNKFDEIKKNIQKQIVKNYYKFDDKMMVATITYEGSKEIINMQKKKVKKLAKKYNCLLMGAEHGKRGYQLTFAIAYLRDLMTEYQIIGETTESSVPWSNVVIATQGVRQRLILEHQKMMEKFDLPISKPFLSWRLTQFYDCSVVIYFMFGFYCGDSKHAVEAFEHIEHSIRDELINNGGSISHHHGIGKLRKEFILKNSDPNNIKMIRQIKNSFDPNQLMDCNNAH